MSRHIIMLHSCNVLNVVRIGLDRCRTRHTCEQDRRNVKGSCANQMTLVCNGTPTKKSTLSQESPLIADDQSRASDKTPENV